MKNLVFFFLTIIITHLNAQKISYSETNKDDVIKTNFEIIGRYNGNTLIYKNNRSRYAISVYDIDMKEKDRINLDFLPNNILSVDFITYPDFVWMVYQYQKHNIVYCMAVKMDGSAHKLNEPLLLDTATVNYTSDNKLYSIINSDNKQYVQLFRINNKNEKSYLFKTLLLDKDFNNIKTSLLPLSIRKRNDLLTNFVLDNKGNFVFGWAARNGRNENIINFSLIQKPPMQDTFVIHPLTLDNISLDEVKIKADNSNDRYVVTSFYYKTKKNIIEGIFHAVWDNAANKELVSFAIPLDNDLRQDAKGENNIKYAFNDFYLQNIIVKKDGGFVITAENLYTTTRGAGVPLTRWDYLLSPYASPYDYYYYNPWGPWGYQYNRWSNQVTRFNADNIVILSFDKDGKLQWSNVIRKSQYDDEGEATISYQLANTGDAIRFLYNDFEKRNPILTCQSIDPGGQIIHNPTIKNLDKGYEFLPRYAKQTGQKQIVVPCRYRNYLTFARLDF